MIARFLSYFTDLSYIGLVAYFWASGVQTIAFALRGQKSYPLQSWPRILQFLHVLLFTTITVYRESQYLFLSFSGQFSTAFIVTVVFWSLLSSPSTFETRYSGAGGIYSYSLSLFLMK